jgi:tetratricopeptide (TPR) repeat protein
MGDRGFKGFKIYRPDKPTNRLEGEHHKDLSKWAPSVHYRKNLTEIMEQLTPSEQYKLDLQTRGKEKRVLQRLELRWNMTEFSLARWTKASTKIKATYRGMLARRAFYIVRDSLRRERDIREARINLVHAWERNEPQEALNILAATKDPPLDMILNAAKLCRACEQFDLCEHFCRKILEIESDHGDAQYLIGSCYAKLGKLDEAYEILKNLINLNGPRRDACALNAYLCMKLVPPKLAQAKLNMDFLVEDDRADMNVLLQRGCVSSHLQDWSSAIDDYSLVLQYEPYQTQVRLLRARAYSCARVWDEAREDYEYILTYDPENWWAQNGLWEIDQPYDELPMVDQTVIDGAEN